MKKISIALMLLSTIIYAKDCKILTSTLSGQKINVGGTSWQGRTVPIVNTKDFKFKPFLEAYDEFDQELKKTINENICKKYGWTGVQNYKIDWKVTDKLYIFIGTYDFYESL